MSRALKKNISSLLRRVFVWSRIVITDTMVQQYVKSGNKRINERDMEERECHSAVLPSVPLGSAPIALCYSGRRGRCAAGELPCGDPSSSAG